eukprot:89002-Chlamydomonas_euryale.AAC.1
MHVETSPINCRQPRLHAAAAEDGHKGVAPADGHDRVDARARDGLRAPDEVALQKGKEGVGWS